MRTALRSDLEAILSASWAALRANGRGIVWPVLFAGLCTLLSFVLVPIPVAVWLLGAAVTRLALGESARETPARVSAGMLAATGLLPFLGSLLIGLVFAESYPRNGEFLARGALLQGLALLVGSCVVGSMALAPFQAAATFRATGSDLRAALGQSLALASRRPLATAIVGGLQGIALALPTLGGAFTALASWASWIAYLALGHGLATPSRGAPRSLALLAVPFVVACLGVAVLEVAVEPRMWETFQSETTLRGSSVRLPFVEDHEASGVWRRSRETGSTHLVRGSLTGLESSETLSNGRHLYWETASGDAGFCPHSWGRSCLGVMVDAAGNRLHDGPGDRIVARVGVVASAAAALGLLALAWTLVAARRASRGLASPGPHATRVVIRGGTFESVDGDYIGRVDDSLPYLGVEPTTEEPSKPHWLVTPERLARLGPREGASRVPAGSWLAPADDSPSAALALHVAHAIAFPALIAAIATLFAGAIVLVWL